MLTFDRLDAVSNDFSNIYLVLLNGYRIGHIVSGNCRRSVFYCIKNLHYNVDFLTNIFDCMCFLGANSINHSIINFNYFQDENEYMASSIRSGHIGSVIPNILAFKPKCSQGLFALEIKQIINFMGKISRQNSISWKRVGF